MSEDPPRYGHETDFVTNRPAQYLPADMARCPGVGYPSEDHLGETDWREGCETCLRRTAPIESPHTETMTPPAIIVFWCEYLIEPDRESDD